MKPPNATFSWSIALAGCLWGIACLNVSSWAADPQRRDTEWLDQLLAAGQLDAAAEVARQLDPAADPQLDLTLPMARLGRAFEKAGDAESAAEFYAHALLALERPAAESLSPQKILLVRVASAAAMVHSGKLSEALEVLPTALGTAKQLDASAHRTAVTLTLQIGAGALAGGDVASSTQAYSLALAHAGEDDKPTAMLGAAWAVAVSQTEPLAAAQKLAEFIAAYPDHADAARAARARAECLRKADRGDEANAALAELMDRWPDSESAWQVVRSYNQLAVDLVPPAVRRWILAKAKADQLQRFDGPTTMLGLVIASEENEGAAWTNLARHLAEVDRSGQSTSDVLSTLSETDRASQAEQLATGLISPAGTETVTAGAREAACRWAGRTQRWSMLAMASESERERLNSPSASRSPAVERLFAEGLMQTGRVKEARKWWNYVVDTREATDFPTLLRCAEAETSVGEDAAVASQRIALARAAAGEDRFHVSLVDLLAAELAIRRSQFQQARSLLENVVRSSETEAELRGRAQWLIGETYFLQQAFAEAIEAYRRVEGIDPGGQWTSAALVQAGKSFEQLGRTREAAICYGNLISRFAESPHAQLARRRMAAITPNEPSTNSSIRR